MSGTFSLRKRRMLTISRREPDHVPLLFANFPPPLVPVSPLTDLRRVDYFMGLGLRGEPPMFFPHAAGPFGPDMGTHVWKQIIPGKQFPSCRRSTKPPEGP